MDHKDQKTPDTAVEPQVDTPAEIDDGDLEVVTGGVASGGQSGPGGLSPIGTVCITSIG